MVRLAKYNEDSFIDSAIDIAAQCGIGAVSMASVAARAGAPIGSLYHRFDSRGTVLARAWLKVRADFRTQVCLHWEQGDTWRAVQAMLQWCRSKPHYARFMLASDDAPEFGVLAPALMAELEADQAALDGAFERCLAALPGAAGAAADPDQAANLLRFVLIGAPVAMVKSYLSLGHAIPPYAETVLRASHDAVCGWATPAPQ